MVASVVIASTNCFMRPSFMCRGGIIIFFVSPSGSYRMLGSRDFVVYWPSTPPNMPFQRRRKCIFHWRGRAGLTKWDRVKILRYSHKLMHWKRVTCELHDSYFRSMTIKHTIPKIEWAIELLYNSVKTGSQWVGDQTSWRQDVAGKATTQQKGPSGPPME